ncbi:hypothetical protein M8J76_010796 [Diaphorina citri]|nr:hypothetical protein M8J75_004868 [Diaphorina citri]KAI5745410.1 hypothetical protein M8J76_010796 [Diaphorina citri]
MMDCIHSSVYLPPLMDLQTQLSLNNTYKYNASRRLHPEQWFTGDYYGCYFDKSQKETRIFESDYDNPTPKLTPFGMRSPLWWNADEEYEVR